MVPIFKVMTKLYHFAAVDVIEIDEKWTLIDGKHEISSKWLKRYESTLRKRAFLKQSVYINSSFVIQNVESASDKPNILREKVMNSPKWFDFTKRTRSFFRNQVNFTKSF